MPNIDGGSSGRSGYPSRDGHGETFASRVASEYSEPKADETATWESDDETVQQESDEEIDEQEPGHKTVKQKSDEEIDEQEPGHKTIKQKSDDKIAKQELHDTALTQSAPWWPSGTAPYPPSEDDLKRMERWIALQERMENLNNIPRQGHTYGELTVTGNARVIRGNVYEDSASLPCLRNHTYGKGDAKEGGMIWEGDISIAAFNGYWR